MTFLENKINTKLQRRALEIPKFFDKEGNPQSYKMKRKFYYPGFLDFYLAMGKFLNDKTYQTKYRRFTRFLIGLEVFIQPTLLISIFLLLLPVLGLISNIFELQFSQVFWSRIALMLFFPLPALMVLYLSIFRVADLYLGHAYKKKLVSQNIDPIAQTNQPSFFNIISSIVIVLVALGVFVLFAIFFIINLGYALIIYLIRLIFSKNSQDLTPEEIVWDGAATPSPDSKQLLSKTVMNQIYNRANDILKAIHYKHYAKIPDFVDTSLLPLETLQTELETCLNLDEVETYLYFDVNDQHFIDSLVIEVESSGKGYLEMELYIEVDSSPISLAMNFYFTEKNLTKLVLLPF